MLSFDGNRIAFNSQDSNLIDGITRANADLYVRDRSTGQLLAAHALPGGGFASGGGPSAGSGRYELSSNGRYLLFLSTALGLDPRDTGIDHDAFVKDLDTGAIEMVTITAGGAQIQNGSFLCTSMSDDGRYVAFSSLNVVTVPGITGVYQIYLRDRATQTVELVSQSSAGVAANGESRVVSVSSSGRYVVFLSSASNLAPQGGNGLQQVYLRDRLLGTTECISLSTTGSLANGLCETPVISLDERFIAYVSPASNLVSGDSSGYYDVFVYDRVLPSTSRASLTSAGLQADGNSGAPSISADGRFVSFASQGRNLPSASGSIWRSYVRDRQLGVTDGMGGIDNPSGHCPISGDGNTIAFESGRIPGNPSQLITQVYARQIDCSDRTPPVVEILEPADGAILSSASAFVRATAQDSSTPLQINSSPAGISASAATSPAEVSGTIPLVEGWNTVVINATDAAGNPGGDSITLRVDTIAPTITIDQPVSGSVFGLGPVEISLSIADATDVRVSFLGQEHVVAGGTGVIGASIPLSEGSNTIEFTAIDAAGNQSTASLVLVLDSIAPIVTINSPENGNAYGPGASPLPIIATVDEVNATEVSSAPVGLQASLPPGGGIVAGVVDLIEGPNTIRVEARDPAGRFGSASVVVVYDTIAPVGSLSSPAAGALLRGTIDVQATAEDLGGTGVAQVQFFVDAELLATRTQLPYEVAWDTHGVADGAHALRVVSTDFVGNQHEASLSIVVDNTAPTVAILDPQESASLSGTIPFTAISSDATSGVQAIEMRVAGVPPSVDGSTVFAVPQSSALSLSSEDSTRWPNAALVFAVRAVDAAGNEAVVSVGTTVANATGEPPTCELRILPRHRRELRGTVQVEATVQGAFAGVAIYAGGVLLGSSTTSPFTVPYDTTLCLDGEKIVRAVVMSPGLEDVICEREVEVNNLDLHAAPAVLGLRPWSFLPFYVRVEGVNAALLQPTELAQLKLVVPGGKEVPALSWSGDDLLTDCDHDGRYELLLKFDRRQLLRALEAGLACGRIRHGAVERVELVALDPCSGLPTSLGIVRLQVVGGRGD
ncbi:MAG: hypothetical protein JNM84_00075 [Planctomycetes bacterium]|nr:hypothetical protein [Planctomycetota bacterium]